MRWISSEDSAEHHGDPNARLRWRAFTQNAQNPSKHCRDSRAPCGLDIVCGNSEWRELKRQVSGIELDYLLMFGQPFSR
jgi:hypothetical protein